jgi:voltage-gated potassium channel
VASRETSPVASPLAHRLSHRALTARRAGRAIALVTLAVTLVSGVAMWLVDREDFPNVWLGFWWAVQTVTTVGYGDITPTTVGGRLIATVVMISGIGFLTVVTASITAVFVETARRRLGAESDRARDVRFDKIEETLARIEAVLRERGGP